MALVLSNVEVTLFVPDLVFAYCAQRWLETLGSIA
jgi:hypothetical protein